MHIRASALLIGLLFAVRVAAAPLTALPYTFTFDEAAGSIPLLPGPSSGYTVTGTFDAFERILTVTGGTAGVHFPGSPIIIPPGGISSGVPPVTVSAQYSGSAQFGALALQLGLAGGSVNDRGIPGSVNWNAAVLGPSPAISGTVPITYEIPILGISDAATLNLSGSLAPTAGWTYPVPGTGHLLNTPTGAQLALPVRVPVTANNINVSGGGVIGDILSAVGAALGGFFDNFANDASPYQGILRANSGTHLPPPPQEVNYVIDTVLSHLSGSGATGPLTGNVGGKLVLGNLKFGGGNAIHSTSSSGPIPDLLVGTMPLGTPGTSLGYDIDLDSIALDLRFDLAGFAAHGSLPSALDWTLAQGTLTMQGKADIDFATPGGTLSLASAPFTVKSNLGMLMTLTGAGGTVGLTQTPGVETLTIPLAFGTVLPVALGTQIDIDAGALDVLADLFATLLAPQLEGYALEQIAAAHYSGLLVASRATVPAPATWLLLLAGAWGLLSMRGWSATRRNSGLA